MTNPYLSVLLLAGVALLQTTLAPQVTLLGAKPDLMLVIVVCWGLLRGTGAGLRWAFAGGLMIDLLSGAPFGVATLSLMLVSYLSALGEVSLLRFGFLLPVAVMVLATMSYNALFFLLLQALGRPIVWQTALTRVILPAALVNTLLMPFLYLPLRRLHRWAARPLLRW